MELSSKSCMRVALAVTISASVAFTGLATGASLAAPLPELGETAPSRTQQVAPDDGRVEVALGFFERLFKRRSKKPTRKAPTKAAPTKKQAPAAPYIQTIKKDPDAAVIAVFGDEFSQDIAWGLKDAFAKVPDVKVEIHSVPRSGLFFRANRNPLNDPAKFFADKPFSFAVVMIGLNDRVKSPARKNADGEVVFPAYEFKSPGWQSTYGREIDKLRLAFAQQDKPFFWVGLPPVANEKLSNDMLFFNDFVSGKLTERGERFIDIWDAFAGEEGEFTFRGPDLNGQEQRLRQKNGIRFNKAGRRKLAFFVEKLVIRALSQSVDEDVLPENLAKADEAALREGRGASRNIFALRKPPLDAENLIDPEIGVTDVASRSGEASRVRSVLSVPEFRADDFSWSGSQ